MEQENYIVYVRTDEQSRILEANSSAFLADTTGWTAIDEGLGDKYDPIPYSGNMELGAGKYYTQDGVLYKCTTGTGQPVYHALAELVGIYVEVVPMG